MSNLGKCASGALPSRAEIGNFWYVKPVPVSRKFYSHKFAFFKDHNWTTTS